MKLIAPNEQGIYKHVASEIKMNPQIFQEWFHYQGKVACFHGNELGVLPPFLSLIFSPQYSDKT